jgi:hypothetical protein
MGIRNSLARLIILSLLTLLLTSAILLCVFPRYASAVASDGVHILQSDTRGIILELEVPAYTINSIKVDEQTCERVSITGYGSSASPGEPELPQLALFLGVPPDAEVSLVVLGTDSTVAEGFNVCPVPQRSIESFDPGRAFLDEGLDFKVKFVKNQVIYTANAFFPSVVAEIGDSGYLRDQRYVQVLVHPVQHNPITGELKHYHHIKLQVGFSYPQGLLALTLNRAVSPAFETVLQNSILNYETAKPWRARPQVRVMGASLDYLSQPAYKVSVDQDGIYELTYSDLQAAGLPVDNLDPRTFQLFNMGSEVAIHVEGEDDGKFDSGDHILFYGQKMNTRYTDTNVYWLIYGKATGLRMSEKDGNPLGATIPTEFRTTAHVEEDHEYWSRGPEGEDRWFWKYVVASSNCISATFTTELTNIAVGVFTDTVRVALQGVTESSYNPDHHTKVYLNDYLIENATWDGRAVHELSADVIQSYLIEGTNTIKLEVCDDLGVGYDGIYFNWFEIDYYDSYTAKNDSLRFSGDEAGTWEYHITSFTTNDIEVFDITEPASPIRVINTTVEPSSSYILEFEDTIAARTEYLALTTTQYLSPSSIVLDTPSDLHSTSHGADYIIITHNNFYTDVLPLANHRAGQGLRTMVVDVKDLYDEFSFGIFDPQAIHDFLAYAYVSWIAPAPSYVLLVGDGNFDFKDNLGIGEPNYIPPYLVHVDPTLGETAADNRYATVSGDDILPDMHIGRLPVQTSAQASTMVNKILNYEQNPPIGDWNKDVLFVADNQDSAGDFDALSDDLADNYLPSSYTAQKVYYKITHTTVSAVRTAIVNAINEGCLLTNYIGHGANQYWAQEQLFRIADLASLTNTVKLPMILPMTCQEGYFHYPNYPCLGESIVRADNKGAIASWSPTGWGLAAGHHYLDQGFFTAVFTDTISEIGTATYLGKLKLYTETGGEASAYRDLMDTFVLFGDPFMKLNLPACDAADYDNDGKITVGDIMQVAAHWNTYWGDALFDRKYDLDDDGDVDIVDVMQVATRWEDVC